MLPDLQQKTATLSEHTLPPDTGEGVHQEPDSTWSDLDQDALLYRCWCLGINLLFAILGSALLFILLPLVALCIYLEGPGPIFYTQERLGRHRRPFCLYKFRSMCIDAEPGGEAVWAAEDDKRVTRVGRILRRTHLDELPQVLNIWQGHMALIGPRPERAVFADRLEQLCSPYKYRLLLKPGLTGWAQVKYGYGENSSELQKLCYDLEYIQRRSIRFDILILLKTVTEVLTLRGR
jgi:lipopolysaccharide/colanic/teichoic acid biosynthesis glycosyltransferase